MCVQVAHTSCRQARAVYWTERGSEEVGLKSEGNVEVAFNWIRIHRHCRSPCSKCSSNDPSCSVIPRQSTHRRETSPRSLGQASNQLWGGIWAVSAYMDESLRLGSKQKPHSEHLHPGRRVGHVAGPYSSRRCVTDQKRSRTSPPFCARWNSTSRISAREIRYPKHGRHGSRSSSSGVDSRIPFEPAWRPKGEASALHLDWLSAGSTAGQRVHGESRQGFPWIGFIPYGSLPLEGSSHSQPVLFKTAGFWDLRKMNSPSWSNLGTIIRRKMVN